jgi:hypothetical protein
LARPKTKKDKFAFKVGDCVEYMGTLFENYVGKQSVVIGRSTSKGKIYYKIMFADGKVTQFVENILRKVEVKDEDNQTECSSSN